MTVVPANVTLAMVARARTDVASLSGDVVAIAKACLLDWLGVALLGSRMGEMDLMVADILSEGGGRASLLGREERARLRDAALVNGMASHLADYDDGLPAMSGHASVTVIPALLALADATRVTGESFLAALLDGAEMAGCVGRLVAPDHYERGFHATGTIGALAAASACARLLNLAPESTAAALGLAGTRAAGLKSAFGTTGKSIHAGWAAMVGLSAAQWASIGIAGASDILGDRQGFARTHGDTFDLEGAFAAAAGGHHILDTRFKRFASCGVTHPTIDALLHLGAGQSDPAGIAAVEIRVGRSADAICNIAQPRSGLEAKFSLRRVAAMALLGIDLADPSSFADAVALRRDAVALGGRVQVLLEDDWPATRSAVTIMLRNGHRLHHVRDGAARARDVGATVAQVQRKFQSIAGPILGHEGAASVIDRVAAIERAPDMSVLLTLINWQVRIAAMPAQIGRA